MNNKEKEEKKNRKPVKSEFRRTSWQEYIYKAHKSDERL